MTLVGEEKLKRAYEETAAIASEFASDNPRDVEMPLAEMFGIDHLALLGFLEEFIDDLVHGTMQAMYEGKLPQETAVIGRQMMAVMVRGMAMGVVLERERGGELERLAKAMVAEDIFTSHGYDSHHCVACEIANVADLDRHNEGCLYVQLVKLVGVRG